MKLFTMGLLLVSIPLVSAQVIIQEVLYDPVSESGGEAVMLFNPSNDTIDISSWTLQSEAAVIDAKIPVNTSLGPQESYIIADIGWEATKDPSLPSADHEEAITLYNTDAGIALKNANGTIIYAVGWGSSSGIGSGLFEGTPHGGVSENQSLRRKYDTDDNSLDFVASEPSFVVAIGPEVPIELDVEPSDRLSISEVSIATGVSLTPGVGGIVPVKLVTTAVSDVTLFAFNRSFELETADGLTHTALLKIPFTQAPDEYLVAFIATNGTTEMTTNRSITVPKLVSIGLDFASLKLAKLSPGTVSEMTGDDDLATNSPTVQNNGNVPIDIVLSAVAPEIETKKFPLSKISFTLGNVTKTLKTAAQTVKTRLFPGETAPLSLSIIVPDIAAGKYVGSVTIGAKETK